MARAMSRFEEQAQDSRPDKKVYSITPAGRAAFTAAIAQAPGADKFRSDFLLAMFFEHFMPPAMIAEAVDERIGGTGKSWSICSPATGRDGVRARYS